MNILFSILLQTTEKMPRGIPPETSGRLLITLLFFKIISDLRLSHTDGAGIIMPRECTFNACVDATPRYTAAALCEALSKLEKLQSHGVLNGVFFPSDFTQLARMFDLAENPTGLSDIMQLIGSLNFSAYSPSPELVALFSRACHACHCGPSAFIARAAPLMAQLLQPVEGERVIDPACGQGTLLTACAALLAQQAPDAALGLTGTESDERDFAMTKMRCHLAGLPLARLKRVDVLDAPQLVKSQFGAAKADIVITALRDHVRPWSHALAFAERDRRFPVRPPADSRAALFWHALACLKKGGRMAVLVPPAMLECHDSHALRQHLIGQNLLEAVITLPSVRGLAVPSEVSPNGSPNPVPNPAPAAPLLLLIHHRKPHTSVAFITPGGALRDQQQNIVSAYHDWLAGQGNTYLRNVENAWFAGHDFALHPARHTAASAC